MDIYFMRQSGAADALLPLLSGERRKRALDMKSEKRRGETIFSYALLRLALYEKYGIKKAPEFIYGEQGKPYLKDFPDIFFSLSHSAGAAACAVSDGEIGLDIQEIRSVKASAAKKFCTQGELEELSGISGEERDRALCRLWCVKESYGKLTGKGFSAGFSGIEAEELIKTGKTRVIEKDGSFFSVSAFFKDDGLRIIDRSASGFAVLNF